MTATFMTSKYKKQQQKRTYGKRAFVMGSWISRTIGQAEVLSLTGKYNLGS